MREQAPQAIPWTRSQGGLGRPMEQMLHGKTGSTAARRPPSGPARRPGATPASLPGVHPPKSNAFSYAIAPQLSVLFATVSPVFGRLFFVRSEKHVQVS